VRSQTVYRLALRAYPPDYRRERADEILGTLADMDERGRREMPRQALALVACGIRRRGAAATGGTRAAVWIEGCRLAALVLLLVSAAASMFPVAWDVWYARLGVRWPISGLAPAPLAGSALARVLLAAALPWLAAVAVCRGRAFAAAVLSALAAALFLSGHLGSGIQDGQYYDGITQPWLGNAFQLADAVFLAAPAALLAIGIGRPGGVRYPLTWLVAPAVIGALRIAFFATSIVFWPLGALVVLWFLAARLSPHLGVAAFAVLVPAVVYLAPTAIGDATTYEYAVAVTAGSAALAVAALVTVLASTADPERM
jgi:hypothetical protein